MYDAIILAGGTCGWLKKMAGTDYRATAELAGRPLIAYIVEALTASGVIGDITIAGDLVNLSAIDLPAEVRLVAAAGSMLQTAEAAVKASGAEKPVLFVTDDIPLLTPDAVRDFLMQTEGRTADVFYPIVSRDACESKFPGSRRTYVKLKEGVFTGGNILLVRPEVVASCQSAAEEVFARRKRPLELCGWLGWRFILRFLLRRLAIRDVEQRASSLLGFQGSVVRSCFPEIGIDADKETDWRFMSEYLRAPQSRSVDKLQ